MLMDKVGYIVNLGEHEAVVAAGIADLKANLVMDRIWAKDHTVWKPEPDEIENRLGWLHSPEEMKRQLPKIDAFVDSVRADGYKQALLLGMGGSSLAPEVFRKTFGVREGYLDLAVLDSTDPSAVLTHANGLDPAKTLFIVSTKSGGTVETLSFFKFFYNLVIASLGRERAGEHFIAITDPGSSLAELAEFHNFREVFLNDPDIGGRYSALSFFGLVPAALMGIDSEVLLDRATAMARDRQNAGATLGVVIGELAVVGRDKLTLIASPRVESFGAWLEQLVAESTGKEGKGILPVDGEPAGEPDVYGEDRLFVTLRLEEDKTRDGFVETLMNAGHPVVQLNLRDAYDLGGEFFRWEMATAVAGYRLGINPFDQPDVESAKILARQMVAAYQQEGALPTSAPTLRTDGITVYTEGDPKDLEGAMGAFLEHALPGSYIALHAYLQPTRETSAALRKLNTHLRDRLRLATTVGYGPRFLHSTGQIHKGDAGRGLFIQLTADDLQDAPIPDEAESSSSSITFGVLKAAQALGDMQALLNAGRRVVRFHLGKELVGGLERLTKAVGKLQGANWKMENAKVRGRGRKGD